MCHKKNTFHNWMTQLGEVNFKNESKVPIINKENIKILSKDELDVTIIDIF